MASNLILHKGARLVTLDEVAAVETPEATKTWHPVSHLQVLEAVQENLEGTPFQVKNRQLALSRDGGQFFATLDLRAEIGTGVSIAAGIRSSIDQSLAQSFCAGNRVFVCDNLSFSSELMVTRKHTVFGRERFREAIALAVGKLPAFLVGEQTRMLTMQRQTLDDRFAESLILRAYEGKIISHLQLKDVLQQWREPAHEAFGPRTAWSLFNAFTEVLKPFSISNPQGFAGRTFRLNALLVPPNEGPADIQAQFAEGWDHVETSVEEEIDRLIAAD